MSLQLWSPLGCTLGRSTAWQTRPIRCRSLPARTVCRRHSLPSHSARGQLPFCPLRPVCSLISLKPPQPPYDSFLFAVLCRIGFALRVESQLSLAYWLDCSLPESLLFLRHIDTRQQLLRVARSARTLPRDYSTLIGCAVRREFLDNGIGPDQGFPI